MKNTDLIIDFDEVEHEYAYNGKELKGITGMIGRQLFPHKYSGIPKAVIKKAAKRGSEIHKNLQLLNSKKKKPIEWYEYDWNKLKVKENIKPLANEYLVSDLQYFGTAIDLVAKINRELCLVDYKTTSTLDKEYLSWQLSICKYFFELINPDLTVKKAYGVHIRNEKVKLVQIPLKKEIDVIRLLECEMQGVPFRQESRPYLENDVLEALSIKRKIKELQTRLSELEADIKQEIGNDKFYANVDLEIKIGDDYTRTNVDTKKLKKDYPEIYEELKVEKTVKGRLTYKTL